MIYLDNAATTPIHPEVLDAMMPYLKDQYGNAGSIHSLGIEARNAIERAREQVAEFIGAQPDQIIFTSGGSEANNLAVKSGFYLVELENMNSPSAHPKTIYAYADDEHTSIINSMKQYVPNGFKRDYIIKGSNGAIIPESIIMDCGFVSVMHTNNETGIESGLESIRKICKKNNIVFHTDCVQAAGCSKLDVKKIGCDFMSISGHKIHAPKGTGALFAKNPRLVSPLIYGSYSQEFGCRGGTENVAGIVGFGKACEICRKNLKKNQEWFSLARRLFASRLSDELAAYGITGLHFNSASGKVVNLRVDGVLGETLLIVLDSKGVCVSAGSACEAHESRPSHVLKEMGLTNEQARESIRVSFSVMNTTTEIESGAILVAESIKQIKSM